MYSGHDGGGDDGFLSFHRLVWREECPGKKLHMCGQSRTEQTMASTCRLGFFR